MFNHILVPLDGSSFGEAALRPAFALADRAGADLTLLNVQDLWRASTLPTYEAREGYLAKLRRDPRGSAAKVRVVLRSGHPVAQIVEECEAAGTDLIVMSTHGRGGVSRLWLGSVADQCIREAKVPILLVRPQPAERRTGEDPFVPERIVVPLDGRMDAERALDEAVVVARWLRRPVVLLHAVEPGREGLFRANGESPRAYLDEVAERLWALGIEATTDVTHGRGAAEAILGAGSGNMVVMSTHGRTGMSRALLGSVADKVVRGSRDPVLLVPPHRASPLGAEPTREGATESPSGPGGESPHSSPLTQPDLARGASPITH